VSGRRRLRDAVLWLAVLAATTAILVPFRAELDKAHISLVLLLVVLGAGAQGGRVLGVGIGVASFLVFDWFFLPPFYTLVITNPLDWLVLFAFLATSIVAAQLLHREQEAARAAGARADDVDRLATLGAEALAAARAEDALAAVAAMIRESAGAASCSVYVAADRGVRLGARSPGEAGISAIPALVDWVANEGAPAAETSEGTSRLGRVGSPARALAHDGEPEIRSLLLPLSVRRQTVGVLHVEGLAAARLDDSQWRFLDALAYYAALGAERVRIAADVARVEALREADRLKDALIASVSHDLRTPLTTIKALAHQLGALGDERSQVIEEQADRLNRLVADLLDLSRLNAGAMPLHLEINAVDDLLSAAVQDTESRLDGRTLVTELAGGGAMLVGRFDLALSIRVLVNLIENAIKYSAPGTAITIAARTDGLRICVSVSDRGPGVPPGEDERIFTPFYRPSGARPDAGSAGLGLALARRMAEWQGGTVSYERTSDGSIFTLELPATDLKGLRAQEAF
jgi:two-component system, OmpR family, sensor histidine kinase KdpD